MAGLHNLRPEKVIRVFEKAGWVSRGQKGSHVKGVGQGRNDKNQAGDIAPNSRMISRSNHTQRTEFQKRTQINSLQVACILACSDGMNN